MKFRLPYEYWIFCKCLLLRFLCQGHDFHHQGRHIERFCGCKKLQRVDVKIYQTNWLLYDTQQLRRKPEAGSRKPEARKLTGSAMLDSFNRAVFLFQECHKGSWQGPNNWRTFCPCYKYNSVQKVFIFLFFLCLSKLSRSKKFIPEVSWTNSLLIRVLKLCQEP